MPARHPVARRIHRDKAEDDAFIARVLELTVWARNHSRAITVAVIVLVAAVALGIYYRNSRAAIANRATAELAQLYQTAASGNRAVAIREIESFVNRFGSASAAREGRVLLGQLHLEEGHAEQAIEALSPVAEDLDDPLGAPAALLLGAAYEAAGRSGEAERVYLRIADQARFPFQRHDALYAAARIRQDRGDYAGAVALYDRLLGLLPADAPERGIYEMRRAEAAARAGAAQAPGD
ncbi:MAG TPA: tetratricopeptide repeat protein [Longimicrobiales bacterium]